MSRRGPTNAAAERAAQNQQTIKTLLKLDANKSCADCKRNKHPRWASWNLGVFVCIRCSGIHRGMGTHISRVKSVDLDAWTDEQLQSVLRWGNGRANKYWESKLAPGHVPSEAKIENFIRTKYESKRWVMEGPMPDPASLDDEGDDDVPLNVVQEKAKLERGSSQRAASTSAQPPPPPKILAPVDLFGDIPEPPVRPSTTDTSASRPPPPKASAPPKATKASDSLLGLDFFGGPSTAASKPSSSSSTPAGTPGPSRPDLKQSILSLYASVPKPQPAQPTAPPQQQQQQQQQHARQQSFGGLQSPSTQSQNGGFGGLNDAFSNLGFASASSQPAQKAPQPPKDPFGDFNTAISQRTSAAPPQVTAPLSGGGFFDAGPKPAPKPAAQPKPGPLPQVNLSPMSSSDFQGFDFGSTTSSAPSKPTTSASNDLFDMSEPTPPAPQSKKAAPAAPVVSSNISSAFNLSNPAPAAPQPAPKAAATHKPTTSNNFSNFSNTDAWGSSDAWATPDPTPAPAPQAAKPAAPAKAPSIPMSTDFSAWGGGPAQNHQTPAFDSGFGGSSASTTTAAAAAAPKVTPDEDFGGWSSAAPVSPAATKPPQSASSSAQAKGGSGGGGGFGGSDDLFSNVWE